VPQVACWPLSLVALSELYLKKPLRELKRKYFLQIIHKAGL